MPKAAIKKRTRSTPAKQPRSLAGLLPHPDRFVARHIGPRQGDVAAMLAVVGYPSLGEFVSAVVPEDIRL